MESMPESTTPTHPGEMLLEQFLVPMKISQQDLSEAINLPHNWINEIVNGKRGVDSSTALRLAKFFGISADFWLDLQHKWDLHNAKSTEAEQLRSIRPYGATESHLIQRRSSKTTLAEIIEELPNGLHDSLLTSMCIDFHNQTLKLKLKIWMNTVDFETPCNTRDMRLAEITVHDFSNCIVEAPKTIKRLTKSVHLNVGTFPNDNLPPVSKVFHEVLPNEQQYWIYLQEKNSFMYLSANCATLQWLDM